MTREPDAPLPGTTPVQLLDLGQHDCRWPVRNPKGRNESWAFCGLPATRKRYCAVHGDMSYEDRATREARAAARR